MKASVSVKKGTPKPILKKVWYKHMVEGVITNLDLSTASGPDCVPVVVLKNFESELSYILAELFNRCLKESCFPELRMLGKGLHLKATVLLDFFLW